MIIFFLLSSCMNHTNSYVCKILASYLKFVEKLECLALIATKCQPSSHLNFMRTHSVKERRMLTHLIFLQ